MKFDHKCACAKKVTFDGQRSSCRSDVEKTGQCAKEEVSSSLLGKLAPSFLCYKHIPSYNIGDLLHLSHYQFVGVSAATVRS